MARSDIVTQIPLDRAAKLIGIDPYHFNTITTLRRPETNACDDIFFQHSHQRQGAFSREDLASALKQAEETVTHYLGYTLIPQWVQNEEKIVTKPANVEMMNVTGRNARGQLKSVVTDRGYVIEGGRKARTLIESDSPVTYSDDDGDGYDELATVNVATTVTDPQEIHLFFSDKSGADKWEIRPINVSISGGNATITFPRYLVPLPELWERDPAEGDVWRTINGDDVNQFIDTCDVYRVYNDPSAPAVLYKEGCSCTNCNGTGCVVCQWSTNTGCLRVRDGRRGIITYQAAEWNADNQEFRLLSSSDCCWWEPDKLYIWYRAGLVNLDLDQPYLQVDPMWERLVVFYALTLIDRKIPGCENTQNIYDMATKDLGLSQSSGNSSYTYALTGRIAGNPLGTKRAAINLWRSIESNRILQGH